MMFQSPSGRTRFVPNGVSVGEFGNRFRKAREKKELSFDDVSNVTKIGSRMLQAIEEERFDRLPGGVFNKGFIRAYAKHLGLNDEDAVADYLACQRQAQIDALEAAQRERPGQGQQGAQKTRSLNHGKPNPNKPASDKRGPNKPGPQKSEAKSQALVRVQAPPQADELPELQLPRADDVRPRRRDFTGDSGLEIPWRLLSIAAVVIVCAVVLWMRRSHKSTTAAAGSSAANSTLLAPLIASAPASKSPHSNSPSSTSTPGLPHASTSNPQPLLRPASGSAHAPALAPTSAPPHAAADDPADNPAGTNDMTAHTSPKSNPALFDKSTAPLTLAIRATENSWISILADGQPVGHETLIAPARTSVRATREIIVKVGNAAGVNFLWNGQDIPADGAEAEVKTYVFDSNGMRVASAIPPPAQ
jgi:cytoskeletal protein RodZ